MNPSDFNQQGIYQQLIGKFQQDEGIPHPPATPENRMYDFRNFVGMMLEELRYSCQILKQEIFNDRNMMVDGFREAAFSLQQMGEKLKETESHSTPQESVDPSQLFQLIQQNQHLHKQIQRLKQQMAESTSIHMIQLNKIQQESYQTYEENFILNQKIVNLQTQLNTKTSEIVEDLKREHSISIEVMNHQIVGFEESIREKDQSIAILEKLVKDYEMAQERKNGQQDHDHSKVLNMLSMESNNDSRRHDAGRKEGYQLIAGRERYEMPKEDSKRYISSNVGDLRSLDSSGYGQVQSPTHANHSGFVTSFSNFRQNQNSAGSIHSPSATRFPPHLSSNQMLYQNQSSYASRQDPFYSTLQYSSNQPTSMLPPRIAGSRSGSRNELSNYSYASYVSGNQTPVGRGREEERERERADRKQLRNQLKRHGSRDSRHQGRESKVDLAKIEQELEGLAKELKTELASISKKKL